MKQIYFIVAFAVALLLGGQVMAQNANTTANTQTLPNDPISEEDLYGLWLLQDDNLSSQSVTNTLANHTGVDILYFKVGNGEFIQLQRAFTWQFDPDTQRLTQQNEALILDDEVIFPAGEMSAQLNMQKDGTQRILYVTDESGESVVYRKIDEQSLPAPLQQ